MEKAKQVINWSELSRSLGIERSSIQANKMPKKWELPVNELLMIVENWINNNQKTNNMETTTATPKQLIEKINIWNPKVQGELAEITDPKAWAEARCQELQSKHEPDGYHYTYVYAINPAESTKMPWEAWQTTEISKSRGIESVRIGIYRSVTKA
jgi:hypothetical protein